MNRLWVRLSVAFSGVIILAIALLIITGAIFGDGDGQDPGPPSQLSEAERREFVRERLPGVLLGTTAVIALVGIGAGVWISRSLTAPLRELETAAQAIGRGDLNHRVEVAGSQELATLGQAFNQMANDLERGEVLRQNLMADVAHELRTPLSVLQGNLRAILDDVYPLEKGEVARLYDQTRHLSRLVEDLHDLARAEAQEMTLDRRRLDAGDLVRNTTELFAPLAEAENVTLEVQVPSMPLWVEADAARLTQAVQNLLANALRHTPPEGVIAVTVRAEHGEAQVLVADSGAGIAAEHLPHIFDRFYRTDRARSRDTGGSGLGLAIVRAIVEAHGGRVTAVSPGMGEGTIFTIYLPLI